MDLHWGTLLHNWVEAKRGGQAFRNVSDASTLIAAEKTGRVARLLEYEGIYCDRTIQRWEQFTGKAATLSATGETFEEVSLLRKKAA